MGDRVQGKVALVTGGASGIGRGCAEKLASEGAFVVVTDIQDALGAEVVAGIKKAGGKAEYVHHDVTQEDVWADVVAGIRERHGRLDFLVNNAGIGIGGSILEMKLEDWRRQTAINLDGVFLGTKHSIPLMRESGDGGSIVNISSVAGLKGSANLAGYCATKGGVRLFTKAVAMECANAKDGIRVNSVHPGFIDTVMLSQTQAAVAGKMDKALKLVPMGRMATAMEVANLVLFLASDESSYCSGGEYTVDGGLHR